jgi:polyisoprenoid-binding protein YceI
MPQYDEKTAECLVFTYKDGLLSKLAHDLKIRVTRFSVNVTANPPTVSATFDAQSLRVINAVKDGEEDPKALSDADKEKIATQIADDVLHSNEHKAITFTSDEVSKNNEGGYDVRGELSLHGARRPISASTRLIDGRQVVEVELNQPDFEITPFKAMMGTLKVKPEVRVRLSIPNA